MELAAARIIARDGFVAGQNHLGPAIRLANQRNAIAARAVFARSFPQRAPGLARQRYDVRIPVVIPVHDDFVLEQNRRTAEAVHARKRSGTNEPFLVSLQIIRRHDHFLPVEEGDINLIAVGRGRAGSIAVQ